MDIFSTDKFSRDLHSLLVLQEEERRADLTLGDGASIAVIGGGPSGSFFSFFALKMAAMLGRKISVTIFEPKNFLGRGATGCNFCGGMEKFDILKVALDMEEVALKILMEAREIVDAENGSIMLLEQDDRTFRIAASFGPDSLESSHIRMSEAVAGKVLESGQPQVINNISVNLLFKGGGLQVNSILCVPLVSGDQKFGVLNLSSCASDFFRKPDLKCIQLLAAYSTIAIETAIRFKELKDVTLGLNNAVQKLHV